MHVIHTIPKKAGPMLTMRLRPLTIIYCPRPGCRFSSSAKREGMAVQALGTHLVQVHMGKVQAS